MNQHTGNEDSGNRDYVLKYYVVCLMDVLGQSERLKGWERLPLDGQPNDQLVSAFAETAIRVKEFGEMFTEHFRRRSPRPPSADLHSRWREPQRVAAHKGKRRHLHGMERRAVDRGGCERPRFDNRSG